MSQDEPKFIGCVRGGPADLQLFYVFLSIFNFHVGIVDSSLRGFVLELGPSFHGSMVEFWESKSHSAFHTSWRSSIVSTVTCDHF